MLSLAQVTKDDILYDLGSGDGRIVIAAAQKLGTRGVGIENDPKWLEQAYENALQAGVEHLVRFRQQNLLEACDFSDATVVTLYLLPIYNLRLRSQLFRQLKPGTRILSLDFDMGEWKPEKVIHLHEDSTLYYWVIPEEIPFYLQTDQ